MRNYLFVLLLGLLLSACREKPVEVCRVQPEDYKIMHLIIERSRPDTAGKYLNYYIDKLKLPMGVEGLPDGNYYGESPEDDYHYKHLIHFTVKEGRIGEVSFDEVAKDGHSKTADTAYCRKMEEQVAGSSPARVYPLYEQQLIEKQNMLDIDAVSGATYSLYRMQLVWIMAVKKGVVKE